MRWLRLGCVVLVVLVSSFTSAGVAAPSDGPGCLNVRLDQCLAWLRATMTLDEGFIAASLARRHQLDVNGRPLGSGLMTISGRIPGRLEPLVIVLHLRPDDTVGRVESNLLANLIDARTEEVYDQSGLYEVLSRLLGGRCPGISKIELYRFFENVVKPRIKREREDIAGGLFGMHRIVSHAAGVPYCGVTFGYSSLIEWYGSADPQAGRQMKFFSSIELK